MSDRDSGKPKKKHRLFSATTRLTSAGRARRRFNCAKQEEWDERATKAVGLLLENRTAWEGRTGRPVAIADLGAGNERLRPLLEASIPSEYEYHPFDLHPQKPTTLRLDVAAGLPDRDFDITICLGLLEYLPSIASLADALHARSRFVVNSYVPSDSPVAIGRREREAHNWSTHATEAELRAYFEDAGFSPIASTRTDGEASTILFWGQ